MKRYSADVTLCATLYVTADTPEQAREKMVDLVGTERGPVTFEMPHDLAMDEDGSFLSAAITGYGVSDDPVNECDW